MSDTDITDDEMDLQVAQSARVIVHALRSAGFADTHALFAMLGMLVVASDMCGLLGVDRAQFVRFAKSMWDDRERLMRGRP